MLPYPPLSRCSSRGAKADCPSRCSSPWGQADYFFRILFASFSLGFGIRKSSTQKVFETEKSTSRNSVAEITAERKKAKDKALLILSLSIRWRGFRKRMLKVGMSEARNANAPVHRILLLGNGVNRIAGRNVEFSWSAAMQRLEEECIPKSFRIAGEDGAEELPSFGLRLQRVLNCLGASVEPSDAWKKWLGEVQDLKPTFVHHLLVNLCKNSAPSQKRFTQIMTTNYDFAMERALNSRFEVKNAKIEKDGAAWIVSVKDNVSICHLHGVASDSDSVVMDMKSYRDALMVSMQSPSSWLDAFCSQEVHVCGFAFEAEEAIMWYALEQRLERLKQVEHFKESPNRFYIYLFYTREDEVKQRSLANLLRSYATQPILIPVPSDSASQPDFSAAWLQVYARMELLFNKIRYDNGDSCVMGCERYAFLESRGSNLTSAYTPSFKYPHLCQVTVPDKKRKKTETWCFYCEIERVSYMWSVPVPKIMEGVAKQDGAACRDKSGYVFYLDYTTGALYSCHVGSSHAHELYFVCRLTRHDNIKDFESLITEIK